MYPSIDADLDVDMSRNRLLQCPVHWCHLHHQDLLLSPKDKKLRTGHFGINAWCERLHRSKKDLVANSNLQPSGSVFSIAVLVMLFVISWLVRMCCTGTSTWYMNCALSLIFMHTPPNSECTTCDEH
jgi:hypothetical protein